MQTYREWKKLNEAAVNPYQHLRQSGMDLGMRGANKLGSVVDAILSMAANKDVMLRKVITYLKAAAKDEPNGAAMVQQLNNVYAILTQAAKQQAPQTQGQIPPNG